MSVMRLKLYSSGDPRKMKLSGILIFLGNIYVRTLIVQVVV